MQPYKSNRFALLFYLGFLIAGTLIAMLFALLLPDAPSLAVSFPLYLIFFGGAVLVFCLRNRLRAGNIGLKPVTLRTVLMAILLGLLLQPGCMLISYLTGFLFTNVKSGEIVSMAEYPLPLILAAGALLPGFFEELVCRGVILQGYRRAPVWIAVLMSSLYFGVLHGNFQQAIYAAALGAVFAWMDLSADSIIPSMISHFTLNGTQLALAWLMDRNPSLFGAEAEAEEAASVFSWPEFFAFLRITLITVPFIVICLQQLRKNRPASTGMAGEALTGTAGEASAPDEAPFPDEEAPASSPAQMWPMYLALVLGILYMLLTEKLLTQA